jgi:hypothetical protein
VTIADSGINKPFDRILKAFADEAPRLFLRVLGILQEDTNIQITPLRPETAPPVRMPDFVAMLQEAGRDPFIFHAEFFARYTSAIPPATARYGRVLRGSTNGRWSRM